MKMEHHKIFKLLNDPIVSQFVTEKQIDVNDLSDVQYCVNNNISFKNPILRSDLCDYIDVYIVMKGMLDLVAAAANESYEAKKDVFKNNVSFRSCI